MGDLAYPSSQKFWTSRFCWLSAPTKNLSFPCHYPDHILESAYWKAHIGKKVPNSFSSNFIKILPMVCIFSYTVMNYLKKPVGTKFLDTTQHATGLSPRIILPVSPFLPEYPLLQCGFTALTRCGLPSSKPLWETMHSITLPFLQGGQLSIPHILKSGDQKKNERLREL